MTQGYHRTRRGIVEHLQDGRLTLLEAGAFELIRLVADYKTGIWWGSAKALEGKCGAGDIDTRKARRILESLERKGYIRRFATERGRGNYPILIDKFEVSVGAESAQKIMRLNTALTNDWASPYYEDLPTVGAAIGAAGGAATAPYKEVISNKELKDSPSVNQNHPLFTIWQEEHGLLPGVEVLSRERLRKCRSRSNDHASDPERFLAQFRNAVRKASQNIFLTGSEGGWKASFDWFIANSTNYRKVLDGNYDRGRKEQPYHAEARAGAGPSDMGIPIKLNPNRRVQ